MSETEGLYSFDRSDRDIIPIDPSTVNFNELVLVLAMGGWMVNTEYGEEGSVDFKMHSMGGDGGRSADVLIEELGLRDDEGEVMEGYSVIGNGEELELRFSGVPDLKFADVAQRLYALSPYTT